MYKNLKKKTDGFTIIEVLIVLAIAALIMLIVFIAVPALQRNAKNNEIRNNASRLSTAVTEFRTNSNDTTPTSDDHRKTIASMANVSEVKVQLGGSGALSEDSYRVVTPGECSGTSAVSGGAARSVAIQFGLKDGGAANQGCIAS